MAIGAITKLAKYVDKLLVDAGIRPDLAITTDALKGAGAVGFGLTTSYTTGVGKALSDLYTHFVFSEQYALDPTGATSSADATIAMFAAAKAKGSQVWFRPGTYLIDKQCDWSGLTVHATGATFNFNWSAADPTQDITGFRCLGSDSHWDGGLFDITGTSFTQANAANINGSRQGGFWIGEYFKAGALTRMERISLKNMKWACSGGFHGLNQIQFTGNLSGIHLDEIHGEANGRAGRLIAFEWGKDTVANKTYHPENITIGTITGNGYKQKFYGSVLFMSGVCNVDAGIVRGSDCAQPVRIVAGDNAETLSMPQYAGRVLTGLNFRVIIGTAAQWRAVHLSGRGDTGNLYAQMHVDVLNGSGNGALVVGGYFEALSASFAGGETGNYTAPGMKLIYRAFGDITFGGSCIGRNFAGYGYVQGDSADADASSNSYGTGKIASLDMQNMGGPAFCVSAPTNSFEVLHIDQINAQNCALNSAFTGNLACFGSIGVAQGDLTRIVEISIGSGRIGAIGTGTSFGIRSPGGNVRANYRALKVGNGTVFTTAVSHGSGGNADKVTYVGCDFVATTPYGGAAATGVLA